MPQENALLFGTPLSAYYVWVHDETTMKSFSSSLPFLVNVQSSCASLEGTQLFLWCWLELFDYSPVIPACFTFTARTMHLFCFPLLISHPSTRNYVDKFMQLFYQGRRKWYFFSMMSVWKGKFVLILKVIFYHDTTSHSSFCHFASSWVRNNWWLLQYKRQTLAFK